MYSAEKMQKRIAAKAMNNKMTEQALKFEEMSAKDKNETHFPNSESKSKQQERYCRKSMLERPR